MNRKQVEEALSEHWTNTKASMADVARDVQNATGREVTADYVDDPTGFLSDEEAEQVLAYVNKDEKPSKLRQRMKSRTKEVKRAAARAYTYELVRSAVMAALEEPWTDEDAEAIVEVFGHAREADLLDTSELNVDHLLDDAKVRVLMRKLVESAIGMAQMQEES